MSIEYRRLPVLVPDLKIDASDLIPADRAYYRYNGSLTTPPCTEGVRWVVMKTALPVSAAQVEKFLSLLHANARPVQPLNARVVLE